MNFSNWIPPARHDRHWVVHIDRPVGRQARRMTDADCLAHALACSWPAGWVPAEASDVIRRGKFDVPMVRVVLKPDGTVPEPPRPAPPEPGRGRVLCYLDPHRAGLVEDRVHLGGGWYSCGVELKGDGRPKVPDQAIAWDADLAKVPLPDYRTAAGTLVRAVQDTVIGTTRWAGEDRWGPFVEVQLLEVGQDDPDFVVRRPTPPGHFYTLHAGGVAKLGPPGEGDVAGVDAGVSLTPFKDSGLSAWALAAWETKLAAGTVL